MKTETQVPVENEMTEGYIPLPDFAAMMQTRHVHPYQTSLSFEPFFEQYKERVADYGIYSAQFADSIRDSVAATSDLSDSKRVLNAVAKYFPSLFVHEGLNFLNSPFKKDFQFLSPLAKNILTSPEWQLKVSNKMVHRVTNSSIFEVCTTILNQCYDQQIACTIEDNIVIKHRETGLEKCYQLKMDLSHIKVRPLTDLIPLSTDQIQKLLRSPDDGDLWLAHFPPENFEFLGFMLGSMVDVTRQAMLNEFKDLMAEEPQNVPPHVFFPRFNRILTNFLQMQDIELGFIGIRFAQFLTEISFSLTNINDIKKLSSAINSESSAGIYATCLTEQKVTLCENLDKLPQSSRGEKLLLERGYKSVILFPATASDGTIPMIFEIGSKQPDAFNNLSVLELEPVFEFMQLSSDNFLSQMDHRVNLFIQEQFTSIHPSVLWKFEEAARKFELQRNMPDFHGSVDEIVFKDVYPLYAQADIVGSSQIRNSHIQEDLLSNLQMVLDLLNLWQDRMSLHLLKSMINRVQSTLTKLQDRFISKDETDIIELLHLEVHPYLRQLAEQYNDALINEQKAYFDALDSELQILYRGRKRYEQSVSKLILAISQLIEQGDITLQKVLPHYFEKYKTDGVEYNMYVGQSILRKGKFHQNHLREFRLWQLVQMCEVTRLVKKMGPELSVPLDTAQLIFVYNSSLSIRFRMDEKQFDVDGTYNVRYEILKKRIDKATVKGSDQRLTLAQTISVVYLQEKDRIEYLSYLQYLQDHGYMEDDWEDLELEKLQGAEGLRALRIRVKD